MHNLLPNTAAKWYSKCNIAATTELDFHGVFKAADHVNTITVPLFEAFKLIMTPRISHEKQFYWCLHHLWSLQFWMGLVGVTQSFLYIWLYFSVWDMFWLYCLSVGEALIILSQWGELFWVMKHDLCVFSPHQLRRNYGAEWQVKQTLDSPWDSSLTTINELTSCTMHNTAFGIDT